MSLKNKIALVTGAGKGLGKGIALELASQGADIIINDLQYGESVEALEKQIQDLGCKSWFIATDITREDAVKRMFSFIQNEIGRLDILVNNAGVDRPQDIFSTSLEDWNFVMQTNITGCFLCSKYALLIMRDQQQGKIVNVSSVVGHQGALKGHVHYASSKSGLFGLTKTLARTAAAFGVNVNAVAPGVIETELSLKTHGESGMETLRKGIPLGLGNVKDVGMAVAFLCSDGARYITGTTLDVNGGLYFR
ncbi:3-oxoacyl-ACP reductase FabG [Sphingobacterium sp. SGG-5]|uniref:SDR family NAD(P)-dependent oxidoreductase n=1 Tax=Sphingobacterium sp. SGG-5 TaxID=2710881 RepID=UPI0013EBFF96|nr:3-oxoacyl-ACP reductase family protein [Sphingobacterium sp. SGG-5]NGM60869.1 3-oxoacyl-ACP reductase FabG [Sphingobacterium sp. SGG-5]